MSEPSIEEIVGILTRLTNNGTLVWNDVVSGWWVTIGGQTVYVRIGLQDVLICPAGVVKTSESDVLRPLVSALLRPEYLIPWEQHLCGQVPEPDKDAFLEALMDMA